MTRYLGIECERIVGVTTNASNSVKVTVENYDDTFIRELEAMDIIQNQDLNELFKAICEVYEDEVIRKLFLDLGSM